MKVNRICNKCGCEKPIEEFHNHKKGKDGKRTVCKTCELAYLRSTTHKEIKNKHLSTEKGKETTRNYNKSKEFRNSQNKYKRKRYHSDFIYRAQILVRRRLHKYLKIGKYTKLTSTSDILGCSKEELTEHLYSSFKRIYHRELADTDIVEIDHIIPLCMSNTLEELYKLSHYSNLQLLLKVDNQRKRDNLSYVISDNL